MGEHGGELFEGQVEKLRGDRAGDLSALEGGRWDVAVDTSGFVPEQVAASSALLAPAVEHLTFVSSVSAYPGWPAEVIDESSETYAPARTPGPTTATTASSRRAASAPRSAPCRDASRSCGPG